MEFVGKSLALSSTGLAKVASQLSVGVPEIAAVFSVETRGAGFLPDRRPQVLFEPPLPYASDRRDASTGLPAPEVSAPTPGGYGPSGAHQHDRLAQAISLDRDAALRSASWGLAQVMGDNHQAAGYGSAEAHGRRDPQTPRTHNWQRWQASSGRPDIRPLRPTTGPAFARWRIQQGPALSSNRYDVEVERLTIKNIWLVLCPIWTFAPRKIICSFAGSILMALMGSSGVRLPTRSARFQAKSGIPPSGNDRRRNQAEHSLPI